MRREPPIAVCACGWGQELRLYAQSLVIGSHNYSLRGLTRIRPFYRQVMGVTSVRLELWFGKQRVTLRGIADVEAAQKIVAYLTTHFVGLAQETPPEQGESKGWRRTREQPLLETATPALTYSESSSTNELHLPGLLKQGDQPVSQEFCLQTFAQAPTAKVAAPNWQRFRQEQRERRQHRLHVERSLREHGFDVTQLAERLKEEALPVVQVPIRLLAGEIAHYTTEATLCDEPVGGAIRYSYPAKEHGTLILTNKRLIYIGRKSQIVLDYGRLLHVSRLRGAIAFQADHWYKREIFEVPRSLECLMFLEHILTRYQLAQKSASLREIRSTTSDSPVVNRYVQFHSHVEEAPEAVNINTMPLAHQPWGLAEVIDTMDR